MTKLAIAIVIALVCAGCSERKPESAYVIGECVSVFGGKLAVKYRDSSYVPIERDGPFIVKAELRQFEHTVIASRLTKQPIQAGDRVLLFGMSVQGDDGHYRRDWQVIESEQKPTQ